MNTKSSEYVEYKHSLITKLKWKIDDFKYWIRNLQINFIFWWIEKLTNNSRSVKHSEKELKLAGLFDKDADYNGALAHSIVDLVRVFSLQGHSGFSASYTLKYFNTLASGETLTSITSNPEEWEDIDNKTWQNKRDFRYFSNDAGKTFYNHEDCNYIVKEENGSLYTTSTKRIIEENSVIIREPLCEQCIIQKPCYKRRD